MIKNFNLNRILLWAGIPSVVVGAFTFVIASSKTITVYADLPQQVEQTKNEVSEIAEYIKKQQVINDYIHQKEVEADKVKPVDNSLDGE